MVPSMYVGSGSGTSSAVPSVSFGSLSRRVLHWGTKQASVLKQENEVPSHMQCKAGKLWPQQDSRPYSQI